MSRINRTPVGLQGFLGSQNFGVNPGELSQTVSPTVDLTPFLGAQGLRQAIVTGARNAPGLIASFITGVTLDPDTYMMMLGWSVYVDDPGTAITDVKVGCFARDFSNTGTSGTSGEHCLGTSELEPNVAANAEFAASVWLPQPIIFEPNITISFRYLTLAATTANFADCSVLYYSLPAG